ncbi:MAG: hypothetical protein ISS45_11875 [Candidatus Omnitrophica bacterium]|nr:hypothetical protein [Candidatus Omnitrophota bacterium]
MILIYRKFYRLLGLIFPLIYYFTNKKLTLILVFIIASLAIVVEVLRFYFPNFNQKIFRNFSLILKDQERKRISGTTYFLIASLLVVFLFEKAIAITSLVFSVFGDAIATIIGTSFGSLRIKDKSFEGSIACFVLCLLLGFILVHTELNLNMKLVFSGALATTVMEILPVRIDDNFTVPVFTGFVMSLVKFLS